jgi:hypothetical protein
VDFKALATGAILGAAACGTIWWLTERNQRAVPPVAASAETGTAAKPVLRLTPDDPQHDPDAAVQSSKSTIAAPNPDSAPETLDSEVSTSNVARAKRWKEERDLAWAYGTEQAIRQYLATNKAASKFEVVLVECRTSFCEVQARGYADDAWPSWLLIMHDVTKQSWSEFGSTAGSAESREDGLMFIATFFRRQQNANSAP